MKEKPTKYKFNIYVNQFAIIEYDLKIDFIEAAIFGMLQLFSHQKKCQKMMDSGLVWHKFQWKIIPQQLPTLGIKGRTACYNRMKSLCKAGMLVAHENNQQNRASWYTFGEKADLYNTVHQSKHTVHQDEHKQPQEVKKYVHNGEHSVHEDKQTVHDGEPLSVHDGEHDNYTTNNYTSNNKDIYIPPSKIGDIETKIPENWPNSLKESIIEFLEYRQSLQKNDRIKTQKGWQGKIAQFSNMLKEHGKDNVIGAVNLAIANEWKGVKMSWYYNHKNEESQIKPAQNHSTSNLTQPQAKEILRNLFLAYRERWKQKYTNEAETDYIKALNSFYYDNEDLKPKEDAAA